MAIDKSLSIGEYMLNIIKTDSDLMAALPKEKCFALCATTQPQYPYMIYARTYIQPNYEKDMGYNMAALYNTLQITVDIHHKSHIEAVNLANLFRNALEGKGYVNEDILVDQFRLISASETTDGDQDWCETMVFETITKTKK